MQEALSETDDDDDVDDNDDDDDLSNDVNGNHQLPSESDINSSQTDLQRETNRSVEGEKDIQRQDSTSSGMVCACKEISPI